MIKCEALYMDRVWIRESEAVWIWDYSGLERLGVKLVQDNSKLCMSHLNSTKQIYLPNVCQHGSITVYWVILMVTRETGSMHSLWIVWGLKRGSIRVGLFSRRLAVDKWTITYIVSSLWSTVPRRSYHFVRHTGSNWSKKPWTFLINQNGQTFDVVSHLRVRRLKWVGHMLRMDDQRYPKLALRAVWETRGSGAKSRWTRRISLDGRPKLWLIYWEGGRET